MYMSFLSTFPSSSPTHICSTGGFPTFYILQVKISTENWSDIGVRVFNFTSNTLQQTLADLQPLVNYDIRIQSQNFNGLSDFSSEITFSTFG